MLRAGLKQKEDVKMLMEEGYRHWKADAELPLAPEQNGIFDELLSIYSDEKAPTLATACQCFWNFRKLHELTDKHPVQATLLGDYFFSVFSKCLILLDSVEINDRFAKLLAEDTGQAVGEEAYREFVKRLPMVISP